MELRALLTLLRRCVGAMVLCALLGAGIAAAVTIRATPLYESRTRVIVSSAQADVASSYTGALLSAERARGYVVLVESRRLAETVRDELGLTASVPQLIEAVQAVVVDETSVLELRVVARNPAQAQEVAQAYADQLIILTRDIETPDAGSAPVKLTVIDDATSPTDPVSPRPKLNIALGVLIGSVLGLGAGLVRVLLNSTISRPEDVEEVTQAAILGTIALESGRRNQLVTDLAPHDPRAEAFRVLRTNLQFVDIDTTNRVLMVTSAMPAEGKTSTVVNLALSLAQSGVRVLLVDGDLRRPRVASLLKMEPEVGLTSILMGRATLDEVVQVHQDSGLQVLTTGPVAPNAGELFQSKTMHALVDQLRAAYDFVLFDSAPLLPVADAGVLGTHTDGALLVVCHKRTTRENLKASLERLDRTGVPLMGVVLNQVESRGRYDHGVSYYYSSPPPTSRKSARGGRKDTKRRAGQESSSESGSESGSESPPVADARTT